MIVSIVLVSNLVKLSDCHDVRINISKWVAAALDAV